MTYRTRLDRILLILVACLLFPAPLQARDALPSWNEGPTKSAIVDFVNRVTDPDGPHFVPREARIATFDNDGCLWSEKPFYFQLAFDTFRLAEHSAH